MKNNPKKVEFVIVEDNGTFVSALKKYFSDQEFDHYADPRDFLSKIKMYSMDTKIILDNLFPAPITGIDIAKMLYERGYTRLYLLTGDVLRKEDVPVYVTIILKSDPEAFNQITR